MAYLLCGRLMRTTVAALRFEAVEGAFDRGSDFGVETFAEVFLRNADAEAGNGFREGGGVIGDGALGTGGVERIVAGEDAEHCRGVCDVARERADAIERGGERDEAEAADAAIGWQHADDAAKGRGLTDGAAGICAERWRRRSPLRQRLHCHRTTRRERGRVHAGCERGRRRSFRWSCPWRTRRS